MLRRTFEADWERKKNYLIRSLFHDIPELSTIRESEELSTSTQHAPKSAFYEDCEPLPDLVVERVPKRRNEDESELFYVGLRKRMRRYYRYLFNKERDGSSSPDMQYFVHWPPFSSKEGADDDHFEEDLDRAFVKDFEADNDDSNGSDISNDREETVHLDLNEPVNDHVDSSRDSVDESDDELFSATKDTTEAEETNVSDEHSNTASSTSVEKGEESIDQGATKPQLHYDTDLNSESTFSKSFVFPVSPLQKKRDYLLKTNDKSKKDILPKVQSEKNNYQIRLKEQDEERESTENSCEISKTTDEENTDEVLEYNLSNANENQNIEPFDIKNTDDKVQSSKSTNNKITREQENEKEKRHSKLIEESSEITKTTNEENANIQLINKGNSKRKVTKENDQLKDNINAGRCTETHKVTQENDKIMIDEIEVMRSHNPSPSTQSIEHTSNSSSPHNIYLERRGDIILRHSLVTDRESMEPDIVATRPMDISATSPKGFHPLLRCSTPIHTDQDHRNENLDDNNSSVQQLNSERRHDMLTKSLLREHTSDENIRQATIERINEREDIATAENFIREQNVPSTAKETDFPETLKEKEFREEAAQTDRMVEQSKFVIDVGVQVQERVKEVISVQVQTDEEEDDVFFWRQRISKSGSNYFFFL